MLVPFYNFLENVNAPAEGRGDIRAPTILHGHNIKLQFYQFEEVQEKVQGKRVAFITS